MPIYTCSRRGVKILFVHIPKCAGGSVEKFFRMNGFTQNLFSIDPEFLLTLKCSPQHFHADLLLSLLDVSKLSYSFAIFREPLERMISEYRWRIQHPLASDGFDSWYQSVRLEFKRDKFILDNHMRSQVDYLIPSLNVFRLEDTLELALQQMSDRLELKLDFSVLENQKSQTRLLQIKGNDRLKNLYTHSLPSARTKKLILEDYQKDCEFYSRMLTCRSTQVD